MPVGPTGSKAANGADKINATIALTVGYPCARVARLRPSALHTMETMVNTEIEHDEDEAVWAAHLAEIREQEKAARAELEAWDHLAEAESTRENLEALAAKYPRHVMLEWLPDGRVNVRVKTVLIA